MALWAEGEDISLTLSAKNGQAKIRLELDIGEIETIRSFNPSYDAVNHPGEVYANSRQRRRDRRLKERDMIKTVDQVGVGSKNEGCQILHWALFLNVFMLG